MHLLNTEMLLGRNSKPLFYLFIYLLIYLFIYLFIYLIHYLISITRSYKTNLHRASIKYDILK